MTWVEVFLALVKILVVVMFLLNMAAVATWADRRQSAMVQDRVGPNRAVVRLPTGAARLVVLLPPALLCAYAVWAAIPAGIFEAAGLGAYARRFVDPRQELENAAIAVQLAILVGWVAAAALGAKARRDGPANEIERAAADTDPRSVFYFGLGLHAIAFGLLRFVPASATGTLVRVAFALLAIAVAVSAVYAASTLPEGGVAVRLAGTLHAAADAIKLIFKEDFVPKNADRLLHALAPMLAMFPALVTFAVIPFGDKICFGDNGDRVFDFGDLRHVSGFMQGHAFSCPNGHAVTLQIADLNVGILYLFAMAGTGVVGAAIAGWSSDNKFSLLGGLRAASQMVSYEVAMGLSLIGLFIIYGGVRLGQMVEWQGENAWGVFVQPFAFFLFLAALNAETKRVPFDQPEGESEIVAGYFVEYSGMKFGMFFTGEYVELITSSALLVTLFFGGYQLPFLHRDGVTVAFGGAMLFQYKMNHLAVVVIGVIAFFAKTILMAWVQIFFRWTLPRFRYDQLMRLGWTKLLPFAIANMLVTGVAVLAIDAAPAGLQDALHTVADVTQGVVALGALAAVVAIVVGLLEPTPHRRFLKSTAARFAAAAGGTKPLPQQA
ncbi:MAG TPA: complex I subunit 1 family protein [Minicystis sp.]|nr:complex I subunit 1 family protein [Minicystis sp.]